MSGTEIQSFSSMFISLILEGLPFIFLGTLISGFIDAYLPSGLMDRLLPRNRVASVLLSALLGIIFPVCECVIVPVIGRLIRKGLPLSCAVTYMLAAPIINPITAFSTFHAFSPGQLASLGSLASLGAASTLAETHPWVMMASRLGIAYVVTVIIGLAVSALPASRMVKPQVLASLTVGGADHVHLPPGGSRLTQALRTAMRDCVDTGMFFSIGVAITAFFNATVRYQTVQSLLAPHMLIGIAAMMILAFLLSLCSTSDAFVAAALQANSPTAAGTFASKLAFLCFGPMMDVKLLFMYSTIFKPRFIFLLLLSCFVLSGLACWGWSFLPISHPPTAVR